MKKKMTMYIITYIITMIVTKCLIPNIAYAYFYNINNLNYLLSFVNQIIMIVFANILIKILKKSANQLNIKSTFSYKNYVNSVALIMLLFYCYSLLQNGVLKLLIGIVEQQFFLDTKYDFSLISLFVSCFVLCLFPAISEEYFFRVALKKMFNFKNKLAFIFVSGISFGLSHNTIFDIFICCIIGMILADIYYKTNCYVGVVLLHFLYNLLSFIHTYILILPYNINNTIPFDLTSSEYIYDGCLNIACSFLLISVYMGIYYLYSKHQIE